MTNSNKNLIGAPLYLDLKFGEEPNQCFRYLMLNIVGPCNYDCLKCFNRDVLGAGAKRQSTETWLQYIEAVMREAKKVGLKVVALGGEGEPMISKDFNSIMRMIGENGLIPMVFTNATALTAENIDRYAEYAPTYMINFDSLIEEEFDLQVNTRGAFTRVMRNLKHIRAKNINKYEQINGIKFVRISLQTALNSRNVDEMGKIREFCGDDIVSVVNYTADKGGAQGNHATLGGGEDLARIAQQLSETRGPSTFDGKHCGFLFDGFSIDVDGTILPCAHTTDLRGARYTIFDWANGNVNNIAPGLLLQIFKAEMTKKEMALRKYGDAPCILRHKEYLKVRDTIFAESKHPYYVSIKR
ncbi:MAG: radical SAM protein [Syntrophales bacterium]